MGATRCCVFLLLASVLISTSSSASIDRFSERDLENDSERQTRSGWSFLKKFGNALVGGYVNKDESGGLNASHTSDSGKFDGNIDWDSAGNYRGGAKGNYSWNNGNTRLGGNVILDGDGKPAGAISFSHKFK